MIEQEIYFKSIIIIVILLVFVLLTIYYVNVIIPFNKEKMYIKSEIGRSTGQERKYWQKKLKKLYVSQIPIFGRIFIKFIR